MIITHDNDSNNNDTNNDNENNCNENENNNDTTTTTTNNNNDKEPRVGMDRPNVSFHRLLMGAVARETVHIVNKEHLSSKDNKLNISKQHKQTKHINQINSNKLNRQNVNKEHLPFSFSFAKTSYQTEVYT